jgi:hypothetical protein
MINPREDSLAFFIAELTQVSKHLSTLNDILAVALAAGMFNKTNNIVSIEGLELFRQCDIFFFILL